VSTKNGYLDVTASLGPERATLLELLGGLSPEQWALPTECPEWDVKGIVLHIVGDDLSLLSRQRDASTDGLTLFARERSGTSFRDLIDGFNEQWVVASEFFSTDLLLTMLELVGRWSEQFYREVGLETTAREAVGFFASATPSPYWQVIAREYVERFAHQSQIRRALGAPELDGDLVTVAAEVAAHALVAWLRDFEAPIGSSIALDFGGFGTWTWRRERDGWTVREGMDTDPTVRVGVAPDRTVAMLSRGLSSADAAGSLSVDGDPAIARGALALIAPILGPPAG
jgi:uncharacterized protein (TIGR03083 family)